MMYQDRKSGVRLPSEDAEYLAEAAKNRTTALDQLSARMSGPVETSQARIWYVPRSGMQAGRRSTRKHFRIHAHGTYVTLTSGAWRAIGEPPYIRCGWDQLLGALIVRPAKDAQGAWKITSSSSSGKHRRQPRWGGPALVASIEERGFRRGHVYAVKVEGNELVIRPSDVIAETESKATRGKAGGQDGV